jgi:hypothetical protein
MLANTLWSSSFAKSCCRMGFRWALISGKFNSEMYFILIFAWVTVSSQATNLSVTVTYGGLGNTTETVTVAYLQVCTVDGFRNHHFFLFCSFIVSFLLFLVRQEIRVQLSFNSPSLMMQSIINLLSCTIMLFPERRWDLAVHGAHPSNLIQVLRYIQWEVLDWFGVRSC